MQRHVAVTLLFVTVKIRRRGCVGFSTYTRVVLSAIPKLGDRVWRNLISVVRPTLSYYIFNHVMRRYYINGWVYDVLKSKKVGVFG